MLLLIWLTRAFIATFGITQPTPEKERQVSLILGGFMLGAMLLVLGIAIYFYFEIHHPG